VCCCVGSFHFEINSDEAVPYLYDSNGTTRTVAANPYIYSQGLGCHSAPLPCLKLVPEAWNAVM